MPSPRPAPRSTPLRPVRYLTAKPRGEINLERSLLTGVAAYRWVAWTWAAVLVFLERDALTNRWLGLLVLGAALAFTAAATVLVRLDPPRLLTPPIVLTELCLAIAFGLTDGVVFDVADKAHTQSFGTAWPLAAVLTAGIAFSARGGLVAGAIVGVAGFLGEVIAVGRANASFNHSVFSSMVLYALGGAVAGYVTAKLREAEREIAIAQAREEVARTLHDGVLQTLAIVQRRATDDDLVALAREQEHELREFLFGPRPDPKRLFRPATTDLAAALRATAADIERKQGLRSRVVLPDELAPLPDEIAAAVTGAVAEALTNAAKHGQATTATIYVEPAEGGGVFCSVKDDGRGFDAADASEGIGTTKSIRGRIAEIGGTVEIDGRPGRGTEVRLWVPT